MSTIPGLVGVVGGGRMGAGIAHAFLTSGADVVVREIDSSSAEAAKERIEQSVRTSMDRGVVTEGWDSIAGRLRLVTDLESLAGRDLVVEAVLEDFSLKSDILAALENIVSQQTVLATNTSSMSIDMLGGALKSPHRFIGLHFFNPVPASDLVEIVNGTATHPQLSADAIGWVEALGKQAISVHDSPGFATSRLGLVMALEAMRMVEEGVASPADIDTGMKLGYKHPMGPLELTDVVGLDVRLSIAEHLAETLGPRFAPPAILRELVAEGHTGRKTGRGFYPYG